MNTDDNNAVVVKALEKKFGNFTAVNRISFEVKKGEIFGFLGPNGAGKSTTIRMLCGILSPTYGMGRVGGYDISRDQELIKQNIGYMSQRFSLYEDLTVEENINFYGGLYKIGQDKIRERREWIIEMAGLKELRSRLTKILAVGWKQRLALGCAIIHEPKIIFLDEPTSGVDPIARDNFWKFIKNITKEGATVFVTTHYMDEAENCDRLALIYRGNIIAIGTPYGLKTEFMKDEVLEIRLPDPEEWIDKLTSLPVIRDAALFGVTIHTVVEDATNAAPVIKNFLEKEGLKDYSINRIQPSLEDVFVGLIEDYDKKNANNDEHKTR